MRCCCNFDVREQYFLHSKYRSFVPGVMSAVCWENMPEDKGEGEIAELKERLEEGEFKRTD